MLHRPGMKRASLVATALAIGVLTGFSPTASAGGYLGLALGSQPGINDDLANIATPLGRSLRGLAGLKFGNLSVEGALNGFTMGVDGVDRNMYQLSGALKLSLPMGNGFEGFGRAGLERTWLNVGDERYNLRGDGFLIGGGFEYRLNALVSNASLFVDYTIHHATLTNTRGEVDETSRIWGLGFTIGI
jgi:hypothetical protein